MGYVWKSNSKSITTVWNPAPGLLPRPELPRREPLLRPNAVQNATGQPIYDLSNILNVCTSLCIVKFLICEIKKVTPWHASVKWYFQMI